MRYFGVLFLWVAAMPAMAYNETVAAISYNPSRMGTFTHLKAVDKATLSGGLVFGNDNPTTVNIVAPGASVTTEFENTTCPDNSDAANCSNYNEITTIQPIRGVDNVAADCQTTISVTGACENSSTSVTGNAVLQKKAGTLINGLNINQPSSGTGVDVIMAGGTLAATNGELKGDIIGLNDLDVNVTDKLTVGTQTSSHNLTVQGDSYKLGNVTVEPGACATTWTCLDYAFVERIDDNGKKHKILAVHKQ